MSRTVIGLGTGLVAVVLIVGGLAWAKPELLAKIRRPISIGASPTPKDADQPAPSEPRSVEWIDDGWCGLHHKQEADCEECRTGKPPGENGCLSRLPLVRLASPEVPRKIGLRTALAEARRHVDRITGNAEVNYATHSYAEVRPRVAGRIVEVPVDEGQTVKKGQVLVVVDSAEVGSAKANYLAALPLAQVAKQTYDRIATLTESNVAAQKDALEARAALNKANADLLNAQQRLLNFGFSKADLETISKSNDTSSLLKITAPLDGVLVERHAVPGEAVEPNTQLFADTDIRHMWVWIDIDVAGAARVRPGQQVHFTIEGSDETFPGLVELLEFAVNPTTKTIRVRAGLENPRGRLRANMFGRGSIDLNEPHDMTVVPTEAVQSYRGDSIVFLPSADKVTFRPQRVGLLPVEQPGTIEVEWGLKPGDKVVTTGSFLLKSELERTTEEAAGP